MLIVWKKVPNYLHGSFYLFIFASSNNKDGVKYAYCSEYGIGYPSETIIKVKRNTNN